jgi:hypothetical protein
VSEGRTTSWSANEQRRDAQHMATAAWSTHALTPTRACGAGRRQRGRPAQSQRHPACRCTLSWPGAGYRRVLTTRCNLSLLHLELVQPQLDAGVQVQRFPEPQRAGLPAPAAVWTCKRVLVASRTTSSLCQAQAHLHTVARRVSCCAAL